MWSVKSPCVRVVGARINLEELRDVGFDTFDINEDDKGNFLVTGDRYFEAVKQFWGKMFGQIHAYPTHHDLDILVQYTAHNSWDWKLLLKPIPELIEDYLHWLKHTGVGKDGRHNFCWKHGGEDVKMFI